MPESQWEKNVETFIANEIKSNRCRFKDIFHDWWTMNQKILIVSRFKHSWNEIVCLYFTLTSICWNLNEAVHCSTCMSNKCLWQHTCVFRLSSTHVIEPATWTDQTFTNSNHQSGDKNVERCYVKKVVIMVQRHTLKVDSPVFWKSPMQTSSQYDKQIDSDISVYVNKYFCYFYFFTCSINYCTRLNFIVIKAVCWMI